MAVLLNSFSSQKPVFLLDFAVQGSQSSGRSNRILSPSFPNGFSGIRTCQIVPCNGPSIFSSEVSSRLNKRRAFVTIPQCSNNGDSSSSSNQEKTQFGYTRKDVLLIGLGVTALGIGLKVGLEFAGVDSLQAGNVVQLVLVLGLTVGWISTYVFRVANKDMTYAQQLRDYENQVMQKRLEGLTAAELEALLEQIEEEKRREV